MGRSISASTAFRGSLPNGATSMRPFVRDQVPAKRPPTTTTADTQPWGR
jgi:hypothetical protein